MAIFTSDITKLESWDGVYDTIVINWLRDELLYRASFHSKTPQVHSPQLGDLQLS